MADMLRCVIVDDEGPARQALKRLLSCDVALQIVGEADSVQKARELIKAELPDVLFLDIQLRGETGFDILGDLKSPLPHLVFVTAYDQHAVRAFECNALDYLLKPVHPERLAETLRRIRGSAHPKSSQPAQAEDMVFLKTNSVARFVPWREVHHIVAKGNYTTIHLEDTSSVVLLRTLRAWKELVPESHWLQVHRSVLVRRDTIREIRTLGDERRELLLSDGSQVPFGAAYWDDVKKAMGVR